MNVASVCTGIAAPETAWAPLGWRAVLMAEIEAFPRAVLAQRHAAHDARRTPYMTDAARLAAGQPWPPMLWGDFTSIKERFLRRLTSRGRPRLSLADIDVLVGGTPCQAFSLAGLRRSLDDDRGNLSLAFVRLANAIDAVRSRAGKPPVWIVWENVPGVLSTRDNAFGAILGGLVGGDAALDPSARGGWTDAGVVAGPRRCAAWRVLDAQFFGLAQRRRRVFVVARGYFGGAGRWDGPDALLPVIEGCGWHPAPRREAWEGVAGALTASLGGADENDAAGGRLAYCLNGGGMRRIDAESETFITTDENQSALANCAVRRLTAREAERLMGFHDDYTAILYRGKQAADGPRYKALGNSMAVPVMAWISARIDAVHTRRHSCVGASDAHSASAPHGHKTRKIEHEGADMASACT